MKWISVKERLPEKGKRVFAYTPGAGIAEYRIIPTDCFASVLPSDITHWMSLPDPPKEESK